MERSRGGVDEVKELVGGLGASLVHHSHGTEERKDWEGTGGYIR